MRNRSKSYKNLVLSHCSDNAYDCRFIESFYCGSEQRTLTVEFRNLKGKLIFKHEKEAKINTRWKREAFKEIVKKLGIKEVTE